MTTVQIYKSDMADVRLIARWGRKHGRPRGRGRKGWQVITRQRFHIDGREVKKVPSV